MENCFDKSQQLELFTKDENSVTPVVIATLGGHYEAVQYLCESGANLMVRNSKGHGVVEIAAIRQDFKLVNYFINLNDQNLNPYIWPGLIKILVATDIEPDMCLAACRCLEKLTDPVQYKTPEYTTSMWNRNCKCLISNGIFKAIAKIINESHDDQALSILIIMLNLMEYNLLEDNGENVYLYLRQDGYVSLINYLDQLEGKEEEIVCLFGKLLNKLGQKRVDAQAFMRVEFGELPEAFFQSLIKALKLIKDPSSIYSYIDFLINMIDFNTRGVDINFDVWKSTVTFIIQCAKKYSGHEHLIASFLRLTCSLINFLPVIKYKFIEDGLALFINETLKQDSEQLRVIFFNQY